MWKVGHASLQNNKTMSRVRMKSLLRRFESHPRAAKDMHSGRNECLEPGHALQNLLRDVLVRNRLKPIALCGVIKQAFLQIRISDEDRNVLRFLWVNNKDTEQVREFRITRAVFGLFGQVVNLKDKCITGEGGFELHKGDSNVRG